MLFIYKSFNFSLIDFNFFVQQDIARAAEGGLRQYNESTPLNERRPIEAAQAMKAAARERTGKLNIKMAKLVAVANQNWTDDFLKEV